MSVPSQATVSWESFVAQVALIAKVDSKAIGRETRLAADLGLDSLAITELVVALIDEFGVETLADRLDELDWEAVTLGQLFDEHLDDAQR